MATNTTIADKMSKGINRECVQVTIAAAELGVIGSAEAQSSKTRSRKSLADQTGERTSRSAH